MATRGLPQRLLHARTVGIYSPSGSITGEPAEKMRLFQLGEQRLRQLGFEVRRSEHCLGKHYHCSGSPEQRVSDLNGLMADPDVDLVIPTIGGHVAAQMLPLLDFDAIADSEKALFGFSDNSILPLITSATTGVVTFHTLCDVTFGFGRFAEGQLGRTEESLIRVVRSGTFDINGPHQVAVTRGDSEGPLLGGNLNGIVSLLGTRWCPDWTGRIMFWESGDPLHRVVSQLTHLRNAGVLDQIAGMIVGRISTLDETFYGRDEVLPVEALLAELGQRRGIPIVVEADLGHDVENVTMPLGALARLRVDEEPSLEVTI